MTTNTLDEIKQAELEAKEIIAQAGQKVDNLVSSAKDTGKANLENAQTQVNSQIEEIIENAKKEIQKLKTQNEHDLDKELDKLNRIDNRLIDQAASVVVKEITS